MSTSVYLIRHGDCDYRPSPLGEAASDFGLSERGRAQALALRDRLTKSNEICPDAFVCSILPRARETADLIAPAFGLAPTAMPEFCEWESGNDALGLDTFMQQWHALPPQARHAHRFYPDCETADEFNHRVRSKLETLLHDYVGRTVTIVAHGGVVEVAFAYFLGLGRRPFEGGYPAVGHTSITHWQQSEWRDEWILQFANDTYHLRSNTYMSSYCNPRQDGKPTRGSHDHVDPSQGEVG